MKKWAYYMIFVNINSNGNWSMRVGSDTLKWEGIQNHFASLGKNGWELVNVVSHIGDTNPEKNKRGMVKAMDVFMEGSRVNTMTQHKAGTIGYLFVFKREISD